MTSTQEKPVDMEDLHRRLVSVYYKGELAPQLSGHLSYTMIW